MKKIVLFIIILSSFTVYSQIKFEKGYIIDQSGNKQICLIKNNDWLNNPSKIECKLLNSDIVRIKNIKDLQEFVIDNAVKYVKYTGEIDQSKENLNELSTQRAPENKKETVLLKTLVEGKASLYKYTTSNFVRYFYKIDNQPVKQLIYKSYLTKNDEKGTNEAYKQELLNALKCPSINLADIEHLTYTDKKLEKLFIKYNKCKHSSYKLWDKKLNSKNIIHFYGLIDGNMTFLSVANNYKKPMNFDPKATLKFGFEIEYILPYNKNKWGLVLAPSYHKYTADKTFKDYYGAGSDVYASVIYSSIEIPLGMRYYMFLNNDTKLFLNAFYIFDMPLNKGFNTYNVTSHYQKYLEINTGTNFGIGIGFTYKKLNIEARIQSGRELFMQYSYWGSNYHSVSLIFKYRISK